MQIYQEVELYTEPLALLKEWRDNGTLPARGTLMKDSEMEFICGLIKKYKPKKIVEVGVAAGGTSTVLLNCIKLLGLDTMMYSVDLAEKYYFGKEQDRTSGFMIERLKEYGFSLNNHQLLLGKVVAERLDEIGTDIDFVILDTTHCLPGEILDYIALFPYMSRNAVVVLHDVRRHYNVTKSYATGVLFNSAVGDKYVNNAEEYPNIAAFRLNDDSSRYIMDVFAGLLMPWSYVPEESMLKSYERIIDKHYPSACGKVYQQAKYESSRLLANQKPFIELKEGIDIKNYKKILLYGTKQTGNITLEWLKEHDIAVTGFVVSDGFAENSMVNGLPVYEFSKIPYDVDDTLILLTNGSVATKHILENSSWNWGRVILFEY